MIYLSIFSPARLSLLTRPGRVDRDLEVREFFFGPSPTQNAIFSYFTI
jgi:hypothetical protein